MQPESNSTASSTYNSETTRKWIIIGIPVLFIAMVIAIIYFFVSRPHFEEYNVTKTGLKTEQNFGYLSGSNLYAFNGLAFYKTNLTDSKTTILSSGRKLPTPSKVFWADDNGALVNFSSPFRSLAAQNALSAAGININANTDGYTWYVDFANGDIKFVDKLPVVASLAYYSKEHHGFYYVADEGVETTDAMPLYFYDTTIHEVAILSDDLGVTDMHGIQSCPDNESICFVARDRSNKTLQKLYSVKSTDPKKVLLESDGRLFSTNNTSLYISIGRGKDPKSVATDAPNGDESEVDFSKAPASIHDITSNKTHKLGFDVDPSDPTLHFVNNEKYYVVGGVPFDSAEKPSYRSGQLINGNSQSDVYTTKYHDGSEFKDQMIGITSHGSGSLSLATTVDSDYILLNDRNTNISLPIKTSSEANKLITDCVLTNAKDSQYFDDTKTFRVIFNDDASFNTNIDLFSKCITKADSSMLRGYNFQIIGADPVNGRLSTD